MKGLDRFVAALAALIVLALGVGVVALVAGWNATPAVVDWLAGARQSFRVEAGLLGLLGVAVGLYLLAAAGQREDGRDDLRIETEGGDIRIALRAIESVVFEAAAEVDGVSEVAAKLGTRDGELDVVVSVHVASERSLPDAAQAVQQRVGARIREVAGVPVARLDVHVRGVTAPRRSRVE